MRSADGLSGLPDEELVSRSSAGDERALDVLLRRHLPLVRAMARSYFLVGGDHDDLVQEGMIGLYKAAREFDDRRGAGFRSFARTCVERRLVTAVRTAARHKHCPLNDYLSLHRPRPTEGKDERTLGEVLPAAWCSDPAERVVAAERWRHLCMQVRTALSDLEAEVLRMHLAGAGYRSIASALGLPAKSIDNALQRVRRKLGAQLSAWDAEAA